MSSVSTIWLKKSLTLDGEVTPPVVADGRLLVTRNRTPADPGGDWYILPGGGQHLGETLEATLVREVREETGVEVIPGPLLWIRELIVALRPDWPFDPGDRVLDFFAGSGTTGEAALRHGRSAVLVDESTDAMEVMAKRLAFADPSWHGWTPDQLGTPA